jgi:trans-2,3-dihydro-3-hydroxyanthranilate isomerase
VSLEILEYQAFTLNGSGGSRVSVGFGVDMESTKTMQLIAATTGAPATVFVGVSEALFREEVPFPLRLRFFTPQVERDDDGYGTIAALHAIVARGEFHGFPVPTDEFLFKSFYGFRRAKIESDKVWVEYSGPIVQNLEGELPTQHWSHAFEPREDVALALGLQPGELHEDLPVMQVNCGKEKIVCAVPSMIYLDAIEPDLEAIKRLCLESNSTGLVAFTFPGRNGAFTDSRHFSLQNFALHHWVVEDAANGIVHAALAAYLAANQFFDDGARAFSGAQGYACGSPSRLEVRMNVSGGDVSQVWIGGKAMEVQP